MDQDLYAINLNCIKTGSEVTWIELKLYAIRNGTKFSLFQKQFLLSDNNLITVIIRKMSNISNAIRKLICDNLEAGRHSIAQLAEIFQVSESSVRRLWNRYWFETKSHSTIDLTTKLILDIVKVGLLITKQKAAIVQKS